MLDENQLDAERHPLIHARLVGLVAEPRQIASEPFPYTARVAFTVRGVTVERGLAARYTLNGGELWVEALGDLTFRAFGIEPYSAFLGSVKNEDQFHVYLSLRAVR
jgi:hypothetical protein